MNMSRQLCNNVSCMLRYMHKLSFKQLLVDPYGHHHHPTTGLTSRINNHVVTNHQHNTQIHTSITNTQLHTRHRSSCSTRNDYISEHRYPQSMQLRDQLYGMTNNNMPHIRHTIYDELADTTIANTGRTYGDEFIAIECVVRSGDMAQAKLLFSEIIDHADISLWHVYMSGCARNPAHINELMASWKLFLQYHQPNTISYSILVRGLNMNYNANAARQSLAGGSDTQMTSKLFVLDIVDKMKRSNVPINTYIYNLLLQQLIDSQRYSDIIRYYNEMKSANDKLCEPDSFTYNTLFRTLNLLPWQSDTSDYIKYWNELKSYNVLPNAVLYRVIMEHLADKHQYELFFELYYDLIYRKVVPDVHIMKIIISTCSRLQRCDDALLGYKYMLHHQLVPTTTIFNLIMTAFGRTGDVGAVMMFWNELCKHSIKPNIATLSVLMQTFTTTADTQYVIEVFNSFPSFNIKPNEYTYSILLNALKHDTTRVIEYVDEMKHKNLSVNDVVYTQVLDSCRATNDIDNMLIYMCEMIDNNYTPQIKEFVFTSNALISLLRDNIRNNEDIALDIIESFNILMELLQRANVNCSIEMYQNFIEYYVACNHHTQLHELLNTMINKYVYPSMYQITELFAHLIKHKQYMIVMDVYHLLRKSRRGSRYSSYAIYHQLIECYGVNESRNELIHLLYDMQLSKHYPSLRTRNCIQAYCNSSMFMSDTILGAYIRHMDRHIQALTFNDINGFDTDEYLMRVKKQPCNKPVRIFQFNFQFARYDQEMPKQSALIIYTAAQKSHKTNKSIKHSLNNKSSPSHTHTPSDSTSAAAVSLPSEESVKAVVAAQYNHKRFHRRGYELAAKHLNKVLPPQHITKFIDHELMTQNNNDNNQTNDNDDNTAAQSIDNLFDTLMSSVNSHNTKFTASVHDAHNSHSTHINGYSKEGVQWKLPRHDTPCVHYWRVSGCSRLHYCPFSHENSIDKLSDAQIEFLLTRSKDTQLHSLLKQAQQARIDNN